MVVLLQCMLCQSVQTAKTSAATIVTLPGPVAAFSDYSSNRLALLDSIVYESQ